MGAMLNGMAAHGGVVPVGVTYLVFSDYLRPTLRLAAMMGCRCRSSSARTPSGSDAMARRTSRWNTWRRCGRSPTCWCCARPMRWRRRSAGRWRSATGPGPRSLIFARQPLQPVRGDGGENLSPPGRLMLAEAEGGARRATIFATGSGGRPGPASPRHAAGGRRADRRGLDALLGAVRAAGRGLPRHGDRRGAVRVAVEAACGLGWDR